MLIIIIIGQSVGYRISVKQGPTSRRGRWPRVKDRASVFGYWQIAPTVLGDVQCYHCYICQGQGPEPVRDVFCFLFLILGILRFFSSSPSLFQGDLNNNEEQFLPAQLRKCFEQNKRKIQYTMVI